ncbi:hypothetical protein BBJ28_00017747 [Nothophytophthora sp. Chile5]|nr:hypothetical protein BBJ28_00017747 [Nothophytophthora sp. Chile5]
MRASLGFKETLMAASEKSSVSFAAMPFDLRTDMLMAEGMTAHAVANDDTLNSIFGPDGRILCTESATVNNTGEVTVVLAFSKCLNDTALGIVEEWVNQVKTSVAAVAATDGLTLNFQSTMVPGACEERSEKTKEGLTDVAMVNQDGAEDDPAQCNLVAHPGKLYTGDVCEPVRTGLTMKECCTFCTYSPCCWHFSYIHHNQTCSPYYAVNGQMPFPGGMAGNYSSSWLAEEELPTQLQAQEVLASDLKRLEAFPGLGEVVAMADDGITTTPIAVISFVTGATSYGEVMQYENSLDVSKTFNFQICSGGTNCNGVFENCIQLQETADVFMYNLFTVTRSLECNNLAGGVLVTYKDDYGSRQCFCGCPAGFEVKEDDYGAEVCEQVVERLHGPSHYAVGGSSARSRVPGGDVRHLVGATAQLPLLYSDVVAINALASSLVPLVGGGSDESTHSTESTWKDYQMNRVATIDSMEFPTYGKYELNMDVYDYYASATCDGCLSIVDKNRPKATTTCPASFCDDVSGQQHCTGTAELTVANLVTVNGLVTQYLDFAGKAMNDACSDDGRCDSKAFRRRDFYLRGRELQQHLAVFRYGLGDR